MKLLFIGCPPSADLQKALDHHSLPTQFAADTATAPKENFELIVWKVEDLQKLGEVRALRKKYAASWIVLVVPEEWLRNAGHYSALLAVEEKDDVWLSAGWESGFWLGIQRAVQNRASRDRERKLQQEIDAIKEEQEQLLASSSDLVARMEHNADLALDVHRKFYPRFSPDVPGVSVLSKYRPASGPGGDYFDLFEFGDKRHFGLLLADAISHRTAASLLTVLLKVRLDDLRSQFESTSSFVSHLNDAVAAEQPKARDSLRLTYAVFDRSSLRLEVTSAGAIAPRVCHEGKWQVASIASNPALVAASGHSWTRTELQLGPGDKVLFHTDGLEAMLPAEKGGLDGVLASGPSNEDPLALRNRLLAEVDSSEKSIPMKDDCTFVMISVDPKALFVRPALTLKKK